jgi:hypothetical protein
MKKYFKISSYFLFFVFQTSVMAASYQIGSKVEVSGTVSFNMVENKSSQNDEDVFLQLDKPVDLQKDNFGKGPLSSVDNVQLSSNNYEIDETWKRKHIKGTGAFYYGINEKTKKLTASLLLNKLDDDSDLQKSFLNLKTYSATSEKGASAVTLSGTLISKNVIDPRDESGQEALPISVLVLDNPINVLDGTDEVFGTKNIQIEIFDASLKDDWYGKHLVVTGLLFRTSDTSTVTLAYLSTHSLKDFSISDNDVKKKWWQLF